MLDKKIKLAELARLERLNTTESEKHELEISKMKAEVQKLTRPFYHDGIEVLKVIGAICGVAIILIGGGLQIWNGAVTAENYRLTAEKEKLLNEKATLTSANTTLTEGNATLTEEKSSLETELKDLRSTEAAARMARLRLLGYIPEIQTIPEDIIAGVDRPPVGVNWNKELKSDSHLLLTSFRAACGDIDSARKHLQEAEALDGDNTSKDRFKSWRDGLDAIAKDLDLTKPETVC